MKKILCAVIAMLVLGSAVYGSDFIARKDSLEILDAFNSVYIIDRIDAYKRAGSITNKEVLDEFMFVERLLDRSRSQTVPPGERSAALKALVKLSLNQMAQPKEMVDSLYQIIINGKDNIRVRIDALGLLREFGKFDTERNMALEDTVRRVEEIVFEIANKPTSPEQNPMALRIEALKTIGSLGPNGADSVFKRILNSTRFNEINLKTAAAEGLRNYIRTSREVSPILIEDLRKIAEKANQPEAKRLRITCIQCIEELVQNGSRVNKVKDLYKLLYQRLAKGDDEEMIVVSRCFLRVNDPEELIDVLEAHVRQLQDLQRGKEARSTIFKALIEFFSPLGAIAENKMSSRSEKAEAIKNADMIVDFLQSILTLQEAPEDLRINAVRGLGLISISLDRTKAAFALVTALRQAVEDENKTTFIEEIENSLKIIGGLSESFRTFEGQVDVDAWEAWYNANNKYLAPEDSPYMHIGE